MYSPIIHNSNFCLPFPEMHANSEEIEKSAIKERRNRFRNGRAAAGFILKMASAIEAVVMGIGLAFADSGEKRKFGGFLCRLRTSSRYLHRNWNSPFALFLALKNSLGYAMKQRRHRSCHPRICCELNYRESKLFRMRVCFHLRLRCDNVYHVW